MKIVSVPRINALGHIGPEAAPEKILAELGAGQVAGGRWQVEDVGVDNSDVEKSEDVIYSGAKDILETEGRVCFVGGDHSITYPIFRAFSEKYRDAFLVVFDAHADCMEPMKEPTHEEFLRAVIDKGFSPENVILVGVRKMEDVERDFLREKGVKVFSEIGDVEAAADYITERAMGKDVYVSVDVDVLDPAFAPAVSYPEANGMSSNDLFYLLKRIFCVKSLRVLDVVEVVPSKDEKYDYRTVKVAAKIVEEFGKI